MWARLWSGLCGAAIGACIDIVPRALELMDETRGLPPASAVFQSRSLPPWVLGGFIVGFFGGPRLMSWLFDDSADDRWHEEANHTPLWWFVPFIMVGAGVLIWWFGYR